VTLILRRLLRFAGWSLLAVTVLAIAAGTTLWLNARAALGARVEGERLARVEQSPQWQATSFGNKLARIDGPPVEILRDFFFGGSEYRVPTEAISVQSRRGADYEVPPQSGLRVTWLGHSTMILEIDGSRVLIDPVWGERASPFTFLGPERFFAPPLPLAELPDIDAVVISHDHYDHLDMPTVKALVARDVTWIVPLGLGAHLEAWGVPSVKITELDWWQSHQVGSLQISATPARHFSGRSFNDANRTLWAGWAFVGPQHRVFYSGDTALHDEFVAIGERLGPFDLTMMEAGAYDAMWADVHLGPEQAVLAHQLVGGKVLMPVHWGMFDLALHGWTEPIERTLAEAQSQGVSVVMPRPGEMFEPANLPSLERWWPTIPWETEAQAPAWSSGVQQIICRARPEHCAAGR
jgi:L-ascorbate metabolism protein UlaG (beta-lactamase superfamily)